MYHAISKVREVGLVPDPPNLDGVRWLFMEAASLKIKNVATLIKVLELAQQRTKNATTSGGIKAARQECSDTIKKELKEAKVPARVLEELKKVGKGKHWAQNL